MQLDLVNQDDCFTFSNRIVQVRIGDGQTAGNVKDDGQQTTLTV